MFSFAFILVNWLSFALLLKYLDNSYLKSIFWVKIALLFETLLFTGISLLGLFSSLWRSQAYGVILIFFLFFWVGLNILACVMSTRELNRVHKGKNSAVNEKINQKNKKIMNKGNKIGQGKTSERRPINQGEDTKKFKNSSLFSRNHRKNGQKGKTFTPKSMKFSHIRNGRSKYARIGSIRPKIKFGSSILDSKAASKKIRSSRVMSRIKRDRQRINEKKLSHKNNSMKDL